MITRQDIETLFDMARIASMSGDFETALAYYNQILEREPENVMCLSGRTMLFTKMKRWDEAIHDSKIIIRLEPDKGDNYSNLGVIITWKIFEPADPSILGDNPLLREIMGYYQECIRRDPLHISAWLNSIETYLFMYRWDDAISHHGMCKPYIDTTEHHLAWSWLGALAIVLAGDTIVENEFPCLYGDGIGLPPGPHDTRQVELTLEGLARQQYHPDRLANAVGIHRRYLSHFVNGVSYDVAG